MSKNNSFNLTGIYFYVKFYLHKKIADKLPTRYFKTTSDCFFIPMLSLEEAKIIKKTAG